MFSQVINGFSTCFIPVTLVLYIDHIAFSLFDYLTLTFQDFFFIVLLMQSTYKKIILPNLVNNTMFLKFFLLCPRYAPIVH